MIIVFNAATPPRLGGGRQGAESGNRENYGTMFPIIILRQVTHFPDSIYNIWRSGNLMNADKKIM